MYVDIFPMGRDETQNYFFLDLKKKRAQNWKKLQILPSSSEHSQFLSLATSLY